MNLVPGEFSSMDGFKKVATFSATLGAAVMYGFLYSIRSVNPALEVRLGVFSGIAFVAGAAITWLYCRFIFSESDEPDTSLTRRKIQWTLAYLAVSAIGMLGSVALALRNVPSSKLNSVIIGASIAICVLSTGGFIIYRAIRFFEEDSERALREEAEAEDDE